MIKCSVVMSIMLLFITWGPYWTMLFAAYWLTVLWRFCHLVKYFNKYLFEYKVTFGIWVTFNRNDLITKSSHTRIVKDTQVSCWQYADVNLAKLNEWVDGIDSQTIKWQHVLFLNCLILLTH